MNTLRCLVALTVFALLSPVQHLSAADASSRSPQTTVATAPAQKKGLFARLFGKHQQDARLDAREERRSRSTAPVAPAAPVLPSAIVRDELLSMASRENTRIVIDLSKQRAYLLVNGQVAISSPASTARPGKYTPTGTFSVGERVRSGKVSTIYNVAMPYWMRLGNTVFGVHAGYLPGYPASAGCVRLPMNIAQLIYDHTGYGTRVEIHHRWLDV